MSKILTEADVEALIEQIAREELHIDTLKRRNRDGLDFHDVAVWNVRNALIRAFNEGIKAVASALPKGVKRNRG